jgi:hypothetical protein
VANTGEGTHLIPSTGGMSAIDVTLTTPDLSPETRWFVHPDSCNSDHLPTITEFLDGIAPPTKRQNWILDTADWDGYQKQIREKLALIESPTTDHITNIFLNSARNHIRMTSPKIQTRKIH